MLVAQIYMKNFYYDELSPPAEELNTIITVYWIYIVSVVLYKAKMCQEDTGVYWK